MARPVAREGVKEKVLLLARERGFVTLEDVVRVAVDEPVDLEDIRESLEEAGFELVEAEDEDDVARPLGRGGLDSVPWRRGRTEEEEVVIGAHILRAAALEAEELMPDTPVRDLSARHQPRAVADRRRGSHAGEGARGWRHRQEQAQDGQVGPSADVEQQEDVGPLSAPRPGAA